MTTWEPNNTFRFHKSEHSNEQELMNMCQSICIMVRVATKRVLFSSVEVIPPIIVHVQIIRND